MLNRIAVTNFKAFATADIPLARYTLMSGVNSTGKSTVLQALAILRQSQEISGDDDVGGFLLNGDLVELGTGQDVLHENYVPIADEPEPCIRLSVQFHQRTYSWTVAYDGEGDLLRLTKGGGIDPAALQAIFGSGFQYLRADRISPAVTYPRSHERAIQRGFLGARGEHTQRRRRQPTTRSRRRGRRGRDHRHRGRTARVDAPTVPGQSHHHGHQPRTRPYQPPALAGTGQPRPAGGRRRSADAQRGRQRTAHPRPP